VAVSGSPSERRSHPRRPITTDGSNPVIATIGILPRAALLCDLSAGGLSLLTTYSPPVGALLPIWLPGPPGQMSGLVLGTVVHVQPPADDGLYVVGVACQDEGGRAVLRELLARLEGEAGE
jgi:hypothetical protein